MKSVVPWNVHLARGSFAEPQRKKTLKTTTKKWTLLKRQIKTKAGHHVRMAIIKNSRDSE